jgi:hypothetical protein
MQVEVIKLLFSSLSKILKIPKGLNLEFELLSISESKSEGLLEMERGFTQTCN